MSHADDQIATIDARIRAALAKNAAFATVVSRDPVGPGATVLVDPATVPIPVRCAGNAFCRPGDRVMMTMIDGGWVITNAWVGPGYGEAFASWNFTGANTAHNATSFGDLNAFPSMVFTKFADNTMIRVGQKWMGYFSANATGVEYGLRFALLEGPTAYTAVDVPVGRCFTNISGVHDSDYSTARVINIPAGTHTVTYRVRRYVGSGSITSDQNDQAQVEMDERVRSSVPIL